MHNLTQDLHSVIDLEVQAGFASRDEIIELAVEYLLDHYDYHRLHHGQSHTLDRPHVGPALRATT